MNEQNSDNFMIKLATFIVDKRNIIYMCFAIALIYCLISIPKVKVNSDITSYLPADTETRQSLDIMDKEFTTYGTAKVMVANITYENGEALQKQIEKIDGIKGVEYDNTEEHYKDASALFKVDFNDEGDSDESEAALNNLRELLSPYDTYISTAVAQEAEDAKALDKQMTQILLLAAVVILLVLLFTSQTYAEVIVYVTVFGTAALLNMGTNYWMGEISSITKSVAVVLQLALAIDYAIILAHRFDEEKAVYGEDTRRAIIVALSKAIVEISSSSLTTISGLITLALMQLKIGFDMGIVLSKGIVFSMVTVFFLMPGLLYQLNSFIEKTRHRSFVPSIEKFGKLVVSTRYVVPFVFLAVIIFGAYFSGKSQYAYDTETIEATMQTEKTIAKNKINDTFGITNQMAVIVPKGDYVKEGKILDEISKLDNVSDALGLANVEVEQNGKKHILTEKLTPREVSEFMDIDYDTVCLLYQAYGLVNEEYGAFFRDIDECKIALIDLVEFIKEEMDKEVIDLEDKTDDFNDTYNDLQEAKKQLEGEEYSRMVFEYKGAVESEESYTLLKQMKEIAGKYYDKVLVASNTTSSYDLSSSFASDNNKISLLTIIFVFVILVFTFRSFGIPALLVTTIQGSIWINFAISYLQGVSIYFLAYLVVSSIQMGATIDYAIVMTNRYEALKAEYPDRKVAAVQAINSSFPTIFTSGSILTMAGFLVGFISTDPTISCLGKVLGKGTLISIILVMLVLPQILIMCDKFIEKTYFKTQTKKTAKKREGTILVNGRVSGYVEGHIEGIVRGVIKGKVDAKMESDNNEGEEDEEENQDE